MVIDKGNRSLRLALNMSLCSYETSGYRFLQFASGALSLSWEAYEPINGCAVHEWFAQDGRDFFRVGVGIGVIALGDNAHTSRLAGNGHLKGTGTVSGAVNELLKAAPVPALGVTAELGTTPAPRLTTMPSTSTSDANIEMAFEKYGKHSLVHVSFSESGHVWAMISTLLDLEIPFRMGEKLAKAWGEGGVSKDTIKRFVQKFILNEFGRAWD
ncbi:hypothetical protein BU17DRAFT_93854 [Hysterangium stoloniferum]|nr:hypothetical protein BU17DRAFT_93854 [Hysterangium stoloniferum]